MAEKVRHDFQISSAFDEMGGTRMAQMGPSPWLGVRQRGECHAATSAAEGIRPERLRVSPHPCANRICGVGHRHHALMLPFPTTSTVTVRRSSPSRRSGGACPWADLMLSEQVRDTCLRRDAGEPSLFGRTLHDGSRARRCKPCRSAHEYQAPASYCSVLLATRLGCQRDARYEIGRQREEPM